jgi:hypothetical protein
MPKRAKQVSPRQESGIWPIFLGIISPALAQICLIYLSLPLISANRPRGQFITELWSDPNSKFVVQYFLPISVLGGFFIGILLRKTVSETKKAAIATVIISALFGVALGFAGILIAAFNYA